MDRPICTQVETPSGRGTARQAALSEARKSGKETTQETPKTQQVLSGGRKKGLTAAHFPGTGGLSPAPPSVPEPGLALQLISVGPLMFPARQAVPQDCALSCQNSLFISKRAQCF